jgi:hypothetical protein
VGDYYVPTLHANQTLIEQFDGSKWSVTPSPNETKLNNGLNSISMTSGGGWAAGYALGAAGSRYQPLAMRWNGSQWALASPPGLSGFAVFTGVDAMSAGGAWAVGFQTTAAGTRRTLVEHASSSGAWTQATTPNDGTSTSDNTLMGVSGTTATGLWAVGYRQTPKAGFTPLILRYDTTSPSPSWVSVTGAGGVPSPGKVETVLTGVDVLTPSDVWAVGYYNSGSDDRPLVLHWNGSNWSMSRVAGIGLLRRVRAIAPNNVWASGAYYSESEHRGKTLVLHFDGKKWSTVNSPDAPSPRSDQLIGLATDVTGSTITLVGSQGGSPLIERATCPTGPVSLPTRTPVAPGPVPVAPGVGPPPSPPPHTPPAKKPIPVTFTDDAVASGIGLGGKPVATWSAVIADFNGDGWPDTFIGQHGGEGHLWINNQNGTFHEVDAGYFVGLDRHDCVAAAFSQGGREDMFCSSGGDRGTGFKSNGLYIQQPDGTFVDQAYQWHVSDPLGRGRHDAVLDANNDGFPDLFSGTVPLRPDGMPGPNRFFVNTGHNSFVDDPAMGLDSNIGSQCAHTVDYNDSGWPSLLVCGDFPSAQLHLFKNLKGHGFKDVSSILGPPIPAVDAAMVDVNHDNLPDLIYLTKTMVAERLQRPNGTFGPTKVLLQVQDGHGLAIGDVNGDNNPDIMVVCGRANNQHAPNYLLIGNASGGFKTQSIPETTIGKGDRAYAVDYNHSGLDSFLVLNGADHFPGPLQLLTPHPS